MCKEFATRISEKEISRRKMSLGEYFHWLMCSHCRKYRGQLKSIQKELLSWLSLWKASDLNRQKIRSIKGSLFKALEKLEGEEK